MRSGREIGGRFGLVGGEVRSDCESESRRTTKTTTTTTTKKTREIGGRFGLVHGGGGEVRH